MKDKVFIDTNILIYLITDNSNKKDIIISKISEFENCYLSIQVINEFANTCIKKKLFKSEEIAEIIKELRKVFNILEIYLDTILQALKIQYKYKYSFYDSLIISTASENGCSIIFTEDLQHNQLIEKKVKIINPFN
jgi:predicted nucleic acid-binding protein